MVILTYITKVDCIFECEYLIMKKENTGVERVVKPSTEEISKNIVNEREQKVLKY